MINFSIIISIKNIGYLSLKKLIIKKRRRKIMKKRMKKLVAIGLTLALSVGLLAGCGKDDSEKGGKTNLSIGIWDTNQKATLEAMIDAYTKENPDVSIEIQLTPWKDYWTKLEASATGGTAPDVF